MAHRTPLEVEEAAAADTSQSHDALDADICHSSGVKGDGNPDS